MESRYAWTAQQGGPTPISGYDCLARQCPEGQALGRRRKLPVGFVGVRRRLLVTGLIMRVFDQTVSLLLTGCSTGVLISAVGPGLRPQGRNDLRRFSADLRGGFEQEIDSLLLSSLE